MSLRNYNVTVQLIDIDEGVIYDRVYNHNTACWKCQFVRVKAIHDRRAIVRNGLRVAASSASSRSPAAELLPAPTAPPSAPSAAGQRHLSSLSARECQLPASMVEPDVLTSGGGGCPKGVAVQTLVGLAKVVVSEGGVPACSQKWWSLTARDFGHPPSPENDPLPP